MNSKRKLYCLILIFISLTFSSIHIHLDLGGINLKDNKNSIKLSNINPSNSHLLWKFTPNDLEDEYLCTIDMSSDGNYIVIGSYEPIPPYGGYIYILNNTSSEPEWSHYTGSNGKLRARTVAISADSNFIVAGCENGKIFLINRSNNFGFWSYLANGEVNVVAISDKGSYLIVRDRTGKIYLFNNSNSNPLWTYNTNSVIRDVAISSDGNYMVVSNQNGNIYLFNKTSSIPMWIFSAGNYVPDVAISFDGNFLVAGSGDQNIFLFSKSNSTPLWLYNMTSSCNVDISSDGTYIVARPSNTDKGIKVFSRFNSTPIWTSNISNEFYAISISSDGNYIAATNTNFNVYFFDRSNSSPIWHYTCATWALREVHLSARGEYLALIESRSALLFEMGYEDEVNNNGFENLIPFGNYFIIIFLFSVVYIAKNKMRKVKI
ncbi:hypothetical protein LCGC14_0684100 [marine sediment metagenome]|uniref:Pyrrolo-quinoline quinone repeat domain-containing protein n=1 Tax=marine sediment metagenome TaxID=412755 RepID=A0A0F9QSD1_9ZZZZ|nr:MAG: WD40 repeat-containing protein [Candidatus Lokiarchaeum sp. GC14_75]HEC38054.1 hypothetical protein [bacterium]